MPYGLVVYTMYNLWKVMQGKYGEKIVNCVELHPYRNREP